jgi:hypothetical protein
MNRSAMVFYYNLGVFSKQQNIFSFHLSLTVITERRPTRVQNSSVDRQSSSGSSKGGFRRVDPRREDPLQSLQRSRLQLGPVRCCRQQRCRGQVHRKIIT